MVEELARQGRAMKTKRDRYILIPRDGPCYAVDCRAGTPPEGDEVPHPQINLQKAQWVLSCSSSSWKRCRQSRMVRQAQDWMRWRISLLHAQCWDIPQMPSGACPTQAVIQYVGCRHRRRSNKCFTCLTVGNRQSGLYWCCSSQVADFFGGSWWNVHICITIHGYALPDPSWSLGRDVTCSAGGFHCYVHMLKPTVIMLQEAWVCAAFDLIYVRIMSEELPALTCHAICEGFMMLHEVVAPVYVPDFPAVLYTIHDEDYISNLHTLSSWFPQCQWHTVHHLLACRAQVVFVKATIEQDCKKCKCNTVWHWMTWTRPGFDSFPNFDGLREHGIVGICRNAWHGGGHKALFRVWLLHRGLFRVWLTW